jgi:pimeloyl-ACP methyl ester carboxylesterase
MKKLLLILALALLVILPSNNLWGQESPQGKKASVNGMEMYYEIQGQGEPLVLMHGFLATGQMWEPFIEELSQHYLLIIPDLRGHGRSNNPNPTEIYSTRQAAKDVFSLLDHLEITKFKAIGVSLGALILLHLSTQQPERVDAQVLIGGANYFPDKCREELRKLTAESYSENAWKYYRKLHTNGDDQIRLLISQFQNFADSYEDVNFTPPLMSTITAKTLIIHVDRDWAYPVTIAAQMYQSIPKSYLWIVPNGGHVPIFDKLAPMFSQTALEFLSGSWEKEK